MKAIILAAGMGTRLRPLTFDTPKALVKVNGEPIIERQIKYLREAGVKEIIIVTGYLGERFSYLEAKYQVKLIHNPYYEIYNNGYTMYLVRDYLSDAYVLEGDVFLTKNFIKPDIQETAYFTGIKTNFTNEWVLKFDDDLNVVEIKIASGTDYIMSGVSYWTKTEGTKVKQKLEELVEQSGYENVFWDDLIKNHLEEFKIKVIKIDDNDWFEIDSLKDLTLVENYLKVQT